MGDTGSERSKPPSNVIPPRCPCGFWGSSKTMNLCSKCFADIQKKQPDEGCSSELTDSSSSQSDAFCNETKGGSSRLLTSTPGPSDESSAESGASPLLTTEGVSGTNTVLGAVSTKRPFESEGDTFSEKRARMGEVPAGESSSSRGATKQKSRRRCHRCQTKLELVQQELGSCRCGHIFCMRHRLPEQHSCLFDHLGRGRQEAVLKMVKLDRKVGRSCQRIGEECS